MKKNNLQLMFLLVCLITSFSMICPGQETKVSKNMVIAGANLFRSANTDYRQVYGQAVLMPELKITRLIYRDFTVWGSFAWISKDGLIEEVNEKTHIRRTMLSFGVGCAYKLNASLRLRGELGLASIACKEEGMEMIVKSSGLGLQIGANLDYLLGKKMFVTLKTAFSQASDEVEFGKIKLGGLQAGVGVGLVF